MEQTRLNILVTGARGFIGKNLVAALKQRNFSAVFEYDADDDYETLFSYAQNADLIYHLAGVNRPDNEEDFIIGNVEFTKKLLDFTRCPVIFASSVQAELDNPYGKSKRAAETLIEAYGNGSKIIRFTNVFGKWCRPNYNSVVATFCHNIANDLPITVNDSEIKLVYIDDVVEQLISKGEYVAPTYQTTVGEVAKIIKSFKVQRENLYLPNVAGDFEKRLYSTYLSYLPTDGFSNELKMNIDARGSFTELLKTEDRGQFSINITKPDVTKGNHWHNTKCEKFIAVSGKAVIRLRKVGTDEILEYSVSGEKIEAVDIPVGYVHSIKNIDSVDLVVVIWTNEVFDPLHPDTFYEEV